MALASCGFSTVFAISPPPPAGEAGNYYVDAVAGEDASDGRSPQRAWKSLAPVNSHTFHAGDSILLKAGCSWPGQLAPQGSGEAGRPIRIGKYGDGPKPAIHADGQFEDAVLLKNQEHWEIADLDVSNRGAEPATRRGVHLALENFGEAHHIVVRGMSIHDVSGRDDAKNNGGITFTADGLQKPSRFVDLLIADNDLRHVDRNGISSWSDRWERSKWFPSLGVVVRANRLEDVGGDGIMIAATDGALIEHNVVGRANQRSAGYNIAIWTWSADNSVIQYNEAWGTKGERDAEGFDSDWNSRNTLIQYNYSHDNEGGFLLICNEGGHRAEESVGNIGTIVRYNISLNDRHRGITLAGPVKETTIYNNTIFVGAQDLSDIVLFTDWYGWPRDTALLNNIFFAAGEARIGHGIDRSKTTGHHTSAPGFGESRETRFTANVYSGKIVNVQDSLGLSVDPQFVAAPPSSAERSQLRGFALSANSPARASGQFIPANGGKDFFGATLTGCPQPDRGAVQSSKCGAP
jgi:hypothetical protein